MTAPIDLATKKELLPDPASKDKVSFSFSMIAIIVRGIVGICIAIFIYTQAHRIEDENAMSRFLLLNDHQKTVMENDMEYLIRGMESAGSIYATVSGATTEQFQALIKPLFEESPYITSINWTAGAPKDPETEKAYQSHRPFAIIKNANGSDIDMRTHLNLYVPIYKNDAPIGIVNAEINIPKLIKNSLHQDNTHAFDLFLFEPSLPSESKLIYFYHPSSTELLTQLPNVPGDLQFDSFGNALQAKIADLNLAIVYHATPIFTQHTWQGAFAASCAIIITSFIVITAWVLLEIEKRQFSNVLHEEHVQEMETTIDQLEVTQNRLVAQENLASLGGLTAGIAHEIKNPLNFINNFSTLSIELIDQLENFINKYKEIGTAEERQEVHESMDSLKSNVAIINEQGQRADSTIQRMLAHSRGKPGEWGKCDIHKLLEEYINLSYHGMRAKNANFNVKIEKEFDTSIKQVEVVANDLSRVFLNLLNNSLQALDEKKKRLGNSYNNPLLTVSTQNLGNYIRIRIRDNGVGIKDKDKANIFTPFFTTKATGFGTGLGLSISYNIIVREHGGSITFDSQENEYTEFIITIPIQAKKEKEVISNEYHGSR